MDNNIQDIGFLEREKVIELRHQYTTITLRLKKQEKLEIQQRCEELDMSVSEYFIKLCKMEMEAAKRKSHVDTR